MNENIILEENTLKTCRICFDSDKQEDIIRPCLCSGGSAYIHRKCLDDWRSLNKEGRGFNYCEVCHFEFVIEPVIDDPDADRKRLLKFRFLVTRDITLIVLLVQAIIIGLAFLIQACDSSTKALRESFPASMSAFGVYYLCSLIMFFAILGLFGCVGFCMGWTTRERYYAQDPCNCTDINCLICCYGCQNMNCDCNGSGDCGRCDGEGVLIGVVVIVVLFAIIGAGVGIVLSIMIVRNIMQRHTRKLWLREQTRKYVVKDFEGKQDELRSISIQPRSNQREYDDNTIRPSAPIEISSKGDAKYTAS